MDIKSATYPSSEDIEDLSLTSHAQHYVTFPESDFENADMIVAYVVIGMIGVALAMLGGLALARSKSRVLWPQKTDAENGFVSWKKRRGLERQQAIMISHSLPDLSRSVSQEQLLPQDQKKVSRQTTLPTVPQRHISFKKQLSQRLHVENVEFSVCSLEKKHGLGNLKPELYRSELARQSSHDSSTGSDAETNGKLSFTLKYDTEIEGLIVKIIQANDLPIKDVSGSSDPYIKIYLLPDRKKRFCTKVHRRNLNPVFNESFVFSVHWQDLCGRVLQFSVYDFDRFSRNDLIGQVVVRNITDYCQQDREIEFVMDILNTKQDTMDLGEIMLSLCYLPTAGRLTITVIKMRNLKAMDITGFSDPYVKVCLVCQGKRLKKKKTSIKKSTLNPVYNESLVFDIPNESIQDVNLVIKVIDYDRIGSNELLGVVVIGTQVLGPGRDHWLEMLETPRRPVAQWYSLLDSVPSTLVLSPTRVLLPPLTCLNST